MNGRQLMGSIKPIQQTKIKKHIGDYLSINFNLNYKLKELYKNKQYWVANIAILQMS